MCSEVDKGLLQSAAADLAVGTVRGAQSNYLLSPYYCTPYGCGSLRTTLHNLDTQSTCLLYNGGSDRILLLNAEQNSRLWFAQSSSRGVTSVRRA